MTDEEKREAIESTWEAYLQCVLQHGYEYSLCKSLLLVWVTLNACLSIDNAAVQMARAQLKADGLLA